MPVGTMWTPEEDERLAQLVNIHGPKKWSQIACDLGTKGSKQCRRRWKNFISLEERKQGSWTPEEDALLLDGHRRHGNKWTLIAQEIGGRTDNAVKNRWAAMEKKRRGDDGPSTTAAAAAAGSGHPGYARYLPPVMRPQNDLLGVRRVIAKDQPRHRAPQQQFQQLQQLQMQQLGGMAAGEGPWAMQEARQSDQLPYAMPAVTTGMVAPLAEAPMSSSMPIRKPDLMINIPGGSAAAEPQLPYSQRPQPNMDCREHQEVQQQLGHGMELPPVPMRVDDDSLLSTSRQAAPGALASPSEPGAINSLCRYLCSATPHDMQQQQLAGGRQAPPPPWATRGLEQQQPPQQLLPPPLLLQQTLLHPEPQQQMQMQYHQVPMTGQMMVPQPQQEQQQLTMIPVQPSHAMLQQQEQHQHSPHMSQYAASAQQQQPGRQVVRMGSGGHDFCQPQMQLAHASPSVPSSAGSSSSMHQQQQQYQQHQGAFPGSQQLPQSHVPAGAVTQQHSRLLPPHAAQHMSSQQQQQVRYAPAGWHMQQQPAQGYGSPPLVPVTAAPGSSGYMPPAISSGMPVMTHQQQQQYQTPPAPQQQQQQARGEEPPRWGPEELRQLLDILGDPQRQQRQQQQQQPPSLLQHHQHLQKGLGCGTGSLPGSAGMSPHVPEEEVEQVNNGHGHAGHALFNTHVTMTIGPDSRPCQPGMRVNDASCQYGVLGMTTAGLAAAGDSRGGCQAMVAPVQVAGQVVQTGAPTAPACM